MCGSFSPSSPKLNETSIDYFFHLPVWFYENEDEKKAFLNSIIYQLKNKVFYRICMHQRIWSCEKK